MLTKQSIPNTYKLWKKTFLETFNCLTKVNLNNWLSVIVHAYIIKLIIANVMNIIVSQ